MIRALLSLLSVALFSLAVAPAARAQGDPTTEQGLKPYGSYQAGDIDNVSLTSGKLYVRIPLWTAPQRGTELKESFSLVYTNPAFSEIHYCF